MHLIPGYIMATSSRSVIFFPIPGSDSKGPVYPAHELRLPTTTNYSTLIKCSSVASGYTPLRGHQLLPLVIAVAKHVLVLQPLPSRPDTETSDGTTPPYISPLIATPSPRSSVYMKLGSEGKRALLKASFQVGWNRLAALSVSIYETDGGPDARLDWGNLVVLPLTSVVAFDEVSGRLYGLRRGRFEVHDLY